MKTIFIIILSHFLFTAFVSGQRSLTKEEIIKYWTTGDSNTSKVNTSIHIIANDTTLYKRTLKLIDSLHNQNIDSLLIYTIAYPGIFFLNSCRYSGEYPVITHFIWRNKNETYTTKLEGKCNSNITKIEYSDLFSFYRDNISFIKNEFFMPLINGAQFIDDNRIRYFMTNVNHEANYSIYYETGGIFKGITFDESWVSNNETIFGEYNHNLRTYTLWEIIKRNIQQ